MVAPAMNKQERGRRRVAPIDVVQAQPLREIDARSRTGGVGIDCHHRPAASGTGTKTPARRGVKPVWTKPRAASGGRCAKRASRSEINLSYILDLALGCRCQGVGNWELPGGVMLSTHPPAGLTT